MKNIDKSRNEQSRFGETNQLGRNHEIYENLWARCGLRHNAYGGSCGGAIRAE